MDESISIPAPHGQLESLYQEADTDQAVIITHPHSLYGGDMYNSVVHMMAKSYQQLNFSTLRFNFRGVGKSTGSYDEGIGEQEDIKSALGFLDGKGYQRYILAGYSFGSWVIYNLVTNSTLDHELVFVSPPIDFISFEGGQSLKYLKAIVVGDRDEFASISNLKQIAPQWNPNAQLEIIEGANHFYSGYLEHIENALSKIHKA